MLLIVPGNLNDVVDEIVAELGKGKHVVAGGGQTDWFTYQIGYISMLAVKSLFELFAYYNFVFKKFSLNRISMS